MLPFGDIYHLCLSTSVPTYCPQVGQYVLILDIHLFHHLEVFCKDRIRNINALEVVLYFFNEDTSLLVYKLLLTHPLVMLHVYNT